MVTLTLLYHSASAFLAYAATLDNNTGAGTTGYMLGAIGSGFLAAMGVWVAMFGGGPGHRSRRTGKDKRMSGLLFGDRKGRREVLKKDGQGEIDGEGIELKKL